jgi:hypothetical protein
MPITTFRGPPPPAPVPMMPPMNPNDIDIASAQPQVDERFVDDWIRFGLSELESYLAKHARFDAYYRRRDTGES